MFLMKGKPPFWSTPSDTDGFAERFEQLVCDRKFREELGRVGSRTVGVGSRHFGTLEYAIHEGNYQQEGSKTQRGASEPTSSSCLKGLIDLTDSGLSRRVELKSGAFGWESLEDVGAHQKSCFAIRGVFKTAVRSDFSVKK